VIAGRRAKWLVLAGWLVIIAVLGPLAGKLQGAEQNNAASFLPASAQSTQVYHLQRAFHDQDVSTAVVVYTRDSQRLTTADRAEVEATARRIPLAGTPAASADGQAMQFTVPLPAAGGSSLSSEVSHLRQSARASGLEMHVTGPAGLLGDSTGVYKGLDGHLLMVTLAVVIVLLLLTYRSPFLWLIPVMAAAAGLTVAQAVAYLLAEHAGLTVNGLSGSLMLILVFGAGTDYALLLVARYREELHHHPDKHRAMTAALRRAAPAITASAATVALGMLCLLLSDLASNRGLGPVAVIGVVSALAVMVTLLPALLVCLPRWILWPRVLVYGQPPRGEHRLWARAGTRIARSPARVCASTLTVLAAMVAGLAVLHASGLPLARQFTGTPDSVAGQQVLDRHFPAGTGSPLIVISRADAAASVRAQIQRTPGIVAVSGPDRAGGLAEFLATPAAAGDTAAAYRTVDALRASVRQDAKVGGAAAIDLDTQRAAQRDRNVITPIVLGVILLVLILLLRALVAPLLLIGTVALSFAASLGASALVFRYVFHFAGADSSMPLFVFIFLVALGVDYNIFLMSRAREESAAHGAREGILRGLAMTGGVITSAGLVLAGTFAALTTIPLVENVEIGFAVAFGVLLDTFAVRSVLVPALALSAGRRFWWPGSLSRPVPPRAPHGTHRASVTTRDS